VVDENSCGGATNQFDGPVGLTFNRRGDLCVVGCGNNRVKKFKLENN
jgi:hypothetical protein